MFGFKNTHSFKTSSAYERYISGLEVFAEKIRTHLINKINGVYDEAEVVGLRKPKKAYLESVDYFTSKNCRYVEGIEKRDFESWHLDHIVPISVGFKLGIPADLIGSVDNLRIVSKEENLSKGSKMTAEAFKLLSLWSFDIETK